MWFKASSRAPDWSEGVEHLRRDRRLRPIIDRVGKCTLHPRRDYFVVLCQSIFTQQISTKVAEVLFKRFCDQFPNRRPTPKGVLAFLAGDPEQVRACGLSRQKISYLADLARHFEEDKIPIRRFGTMSDEAVIASLTQVKGVGRWTAEMFLIFVLNRPDVLPVDDLGLRIGAAKVLGLDERPTPKQVEAAAEPWRPWRTLATWYIWRGIEG